MHEKAADLDGMLGVLARLAKEPEIKRGREWNWDGVGKFGIITTWAEGFLYDVTESDRFWIIC
jgi:hypothetical protein